MGNNCKVLLADANEGFRTLLAEQLGKTEGFTVAGAVGDGREALRVARETHPDLLVTDVILPGLDGLALLRQLPQEGRPKILVLSALYNDATVTDALNALDRLNVGRAKELLMQAQLRAEGEYLASGEEETQTGHRESRRPAALFG